MARKPNYQFDRFERQRKKAEKKAERLRAKQEKAAEKNNQETTPTSPDAPQD